MVVREGAVEIGQRVQLGQFKVRRKALEDERIEDEDRRQEEGGEDGAQAKVGAVVEREEDERRQQVKLGGGAEKPGGLIALFFETGQKCYQK